MATSAEGRTLERRRAFIKRAHRHCFAALRGRQALGWSAGRVAKSCDNKMRTCTSCAGPHLLVVSSQAYLKFWSAKSQLTIAQNASTYAGRAFR